MLGDNSFYSIEVRDSAGFLGTDAVLPEESLLLSGESKDIVLPLVDGINYIISNPIMNTPINYEQTVDTDANTVTIKIKDISSPVLISTSDGTPTITYNASINGQMTTIGQFPVSRQVLENDGTINNQESITEAVKMSAQNTYRVLDIDAEKLSVSITNGNNRHFYYSFLGWRVGSTNEIIKPGDEFTLNELKAYADEATNNVNLTAVWSVADTNGRISSINFYVNLNCEIADNMSNGYRSDIQNADEFTESIYTSRIFGTENVPLTSSSTDPYRTQIIAPPTSADNNWEYEWENLPLYTDGEPAVYSLREVAIGSTAYDPDTDSDGYTNYMVTYDTPLYKEGVDGTYAEDQTWLDDDGVRHYADHALLVLHNRLIEGEIAFAKVDDLGRPLQGAEFTLYSDEACTKEIETATSDISGEVEFATKASGTYYMKETKSPDDYLANNTVYKIVIKAGKATITENGGTTPISSITNYYSLRNLEFSFIKVGEDNQALSGAEFGLYKLICTDETHDHSSDQIKINSDGTPADGYDSCWELVSLQTSARKTGLVKFSGLRGSDTYRLIETKAPNGYASPKGQWQITYNRDVTPQEYSITAIGTVSQIPAFEKVQNELAPYRLMNYKLNDIPSSGAIGITPFVAVGGILFGLGVIIILIIKKRGRK